MADPYEEYQAYVTQWANLKSMIRLYPPKDKRRGDSEEFLRVVENEMALLRACLGIAPEDDDAMIAAIESIVGNTKTIQGFLDIMLNDPY